jgi:hypothetical protein
MHGGSATPVKMNGTKVEKNIEVSISSNDTANTQTITAGPDEGLIQALQADGHLSSGSNLIEFENGTLKVNGNIIDAEKYKSMIKGDKMTIKIEEKTTRTK